ncbi:MAG: 30S ribosomal protein S27ae [Candidatus Argoarchaeum ethanivorans]|uniref:Small ribosomal subunit protein eS31 n=2 Tax=Candidatus Argoarchaeum ethanivorans TaxID=2608793 RepID=A0A811THA8_9EURY|nr:MAG: 30S ribosomal protein S27ae [Candidatus Argoarchaeum ethanivorans]
MMMQPKNYYKIEGDTLKRLKVTCAKCGEGVFLAEHEDRRSCGRCGYTEYKK